MPGMLAPRPLRPPVRRCPAPRPIGPSACGRRLEAGASLCRVHQSTDAERVCGAATGNRRDGAPCKAWPLADLPFCEAHDPQLKAERRIARECVVDHLARVRKALRAATVPVLARLIDQLVTSQRIRTEEVTALLRTWGAAR